jgi:hypothetical protein
MLKVNVSEARGANREAEGPDAKKLKGIQTAQQKKETDAHRLSFSLLQLLLGTSAISLRIEEVVDQSGKNNQQEPPHPK